MKTNYQHQTEILFKWLMFFGSITFFGLISAYYPVHGNIPLIVIPSLLVLALAKPVFFEKLKLSTLVIMRILIVFAFYNIFDRQRYVNLILWMLIINILEATLTDLLRHKKYFNAISGFFVAAGVFALQGVWISDAPFGQFYIARGTAVIITACYVAAYTLWNWIFVTDEFSPAVALMHIGFLGAPLFGSLISSAIDPVNGGLGMWLLLRANSLAIGGWMQIGAKKWFEAEFSDEKFQKFVQATQKTIPQIIFMLINIILIGIALYVAAKNHSIQIPSIFFQ